MTISKQKKLLKKNVFLFPLTWKNTPKNLKLFIKCVDLPCALIVVFWKTFSLFGGYFDFFPDYSYSICWLFGLEDKYFPQGIPGLFWKLVIFIIHIWNLFSWHIFFSLSYIYILVLAKMQNSFRFWKFCDQYRLIWRMLHVCCCFKATEVQSFHN